jgi:hypothetical protein
VGSPFALGDATFSGAAYVYEFENNQWLFRQKLFASDGNDGDGFGTSTAMNMDTIFVGAALDNAAGPLTDAGSVYVFNQVGEVWTEASDLLSPSPASFERFGRSLAAHEEVLAVGAPRDKPALGQAGSGYVFRRDPGGTWVFDHSISSGASDGDQFGLSAAVSGSQTVFGAPLDQMGDGLGAAYIEYIGPVAVTDFDADGDTDLADFEKVRGCLTDAGIVPDGTCIVSDLDNDHDVDLADAAGFLNALACPD